MGESTNDGCSLCVHREKTGVTVLYNGCCLLCVQGEKSWVTVLIRLFRVVCSPRRDMGDSTNESYSMLCVHRDKHGRQY